MVSRDNLTLQIRTELFDHGVMPCPPRLNSSTILNVARTLTMNSAEGKLSATTWAETAINQLNISLHEAEVYFETFRTLGYSQRPAQLNVDVKPFLVFLSLQLFSTSTSRMSLENASSLNSKFNVEFPGFGGTFPSPMTSPRSKGVRGFLFSQPATDYQMAHQFVKSNLRLILKLISGESELSLSDISVLELVLAPVGVDYPLVRLFPGGQGKPPSARFRSEEVYEWINRKLVAPSNETVGVMPNVVMLNGVNKSVLVKHAEWEGKDIRISNLEESYIYVNASVKQISLVNCRETTLFVAGAQKVVSMDKCEQCYLTAATNFIRVGNSVDCSIYIYSPVAPVLFGDNHGLVIGPFNVFYTDLPQIVERSGIPRAAKNLQNWYTPIEMNKMNSERNDRCFSDVLPKDFFKLVLPQSFMPLNPSPIFTPEEFVTAQSLKEDYFQAIQKMISSAQLTEDQEKKLHLAIQGHFREWLVSSGSLKGPLELVRLIDQE